MVIGAISPAEANVRAGCAALGLDQATCDEKVKSVTMPDGTVCDGDIVISAAGKRCIPGAVAAAAAAQRAAALGTKFDPLAPSASGASSRAATSWFLFGVVATITIGVAVYLESRS